MTQMTHKYHYFYKTVRISTNEYYYGIHSTNNINDGYQGSGKRIQNIIKAGHKVETTIIKHFNSRHDALLYEAQIVNNDLIKDELCLNLIAGGSGFVRLPNHTELSRIKQVETRRNNNNYTVSESMKNKLRIKRKEQEERLRIKIKKSNGVYVTPVGTFYSTIDAAIANNTNSPQTIINRCKSDKHPDYAFFIKDKK